MRVAEEIRQAHPQLEKCMKLLEETWEQAEAGYFAP